MSGSIAHNLDINATTYPKRNKTDILTQPMKKEQADRIVEAVRNMFYPKEIFNHEALSGREVISINDLRTALESVELTSEREVLELLERASWLVGNPGTNISSGTDLACESWQNDYKKYTQQKGETKCTTKKK